MTGNWWMIWPDNPALSALVLFVVTVPFLYAARTPAHGAIRAASRILSGPLRIGARWLMNTAEELRQRNKAVLLAHGREEMRQTIEREFERISALVQRDLHGYPALQRKLMDEITKIEEDYQKCGEVPPPSPEWTEAVTAMTKIKPSTGLVEKILEDISNSIEKMHDKSLAEYRRAYQDRHKILKGFNPFWRSLNQTLTQVDRNISGLQTSTQKIDAQMDKFDQINKGTDKAEQALTASAFRQFTIDAIVIAIAVGAAFVNFRLIALPMSEMVGGGDYITNNLQASDVAALVIIFVEATMGLFLMESLGVTHLFPKISTMSPLMRRRMMWASFSILLTLACIEVALAVMRDQIVTSQIALKLALGNVEAQQVAEAGWVTKIPTAGQMILGFILPFALAFIAVPLESFITSSRTVLGVALVLGIRMLAFLMRLTGNIARHIGNTVVNLYDISIFIPLVIERLVRAGGAASERRAKDRQGVASFPKRNAGERTERTATGEF